MRQMRTEEKMISFKIKGSAKAQKRHRHTKSGFTYDPSSDDKQDLLVVMHQFAPKRPLNGPISIQAYFYLPYPKKWIRTGKHNGQIKESAPLFVATRPDVDNYLKFLFDAMGRGVFFLDDSQIAYLQSFKVYSLEPRIEIYIEEISKGWNPPSQSAASALIEMD